MEDSINHSSINNAVFPSKKTSTGSSEEDSGWIAYFEDFSAHNDREDGCFPSGFDSSSMVSDAASFPAWKSSHSNPVEAFCPTGVSPNPPKRLTCKKTRANEICHDDSLEDTASSPVNSPKVGDWRPIDMNSRKTNDYFNRSLGKGETVNHYGGLMKTDEGCEVSFSEKNEHADLKKRGLCLVPCSMFGNYLG